MKRKPTNKSKLTAFCDKRFVSFDYDGVNTIYTSVQRCAYITYNYSSVSVTE